MQTPKSKLHARFSLCRFLVLISSLRVLAAFLLVFIPLSNESKAQNLAPSYISLGRGITDVASKRVIQLVCTDTDCESAQLILFENNKQKKIGAEIQFSNGMKALKTNLEILYKPVYLKEDLRISPKSIVEVLFDQDGFNWSSRPLKVNSQAFDRLLGVYSLWSIYGSQQIEYDIEASDHYVGEFIGMVEEADTHRMLILSKTEAEIILTLISSGTPQIKKRWAIDDFYLPRANSVSTSVSLRLTGWLFRADGQVIRSCAKRLYGGIEMFVQGDAASAVGGILFSAILLGPCLVISTVPAVAGLAVLPAELIFDLFYNLSWYRSGPIRKALKRTNNGNSYVVSKRKFYKILEGI